MAELKDMAITTIEIVPGLTIAAKMNFTTMAKVEVKFDKPFTEVEFKWTKDLIFLYKILAEQAGMEITEEKVEELLNIAIEKGVDVNKKLEKVMSGKDSKNSQKLNRAKRRRKP